MKTTYFGGGTGGGGGAVSSVFTRVGAVAAALNDYVASLVGNDSTVTGATVKDALNALKAASGVTSVFTRTGAVVAAVNDYAASLISNNSSVSGATVKDALNALGTGSAGNWLSANASGIMVASDIALSNKILSYSAADALGALLTLRKSRGTSGSPTAHNAGDILAEWLAQGYNGAAYGDVGNLNFVAEDAGATSLAARFDSYINNSAAKVLTQSSRQVAKTFNDAAAHTVYSIDVPADSILSIGIRWTAKQQASTNRALRETSLLARRIGSGSITLLGNIDTPGGFTDVAPWAMAFAANDGTHKIDVSVQGNGVVFVDWLVDISWGTR